MRNGSAPTGLLLRLSLCVNESGADPRGHAPVPPTRSEKRIRTVRRRAGGATLLVLALATTGCAGNPTAGARVRRARYLMGTVLEIDALGRNRADLNAAVERAFDAVARVEARLSNWRPDSELSRINRAPGETVRVSRETCVSLSAALALAAETEGAFDPTVGAVTEALGLTGAAPEASRARAAAASVGWRRVRLDCGTGVLRRPRGVVFDSGAFGKGEALDRAAAVLKNAGATAGRLNFGGQILLFGSATPAARAAGLDEIVVAAPDPSAAASAAAFAAGDGSVSTSGDSEKPGHLVDPRTGRVSRFHGSATVRAASGLRADALSTALFVLGPSEGVAFAARRGIAALYVFRDGRRLATSTSPAFPRLARPAHRKETA